MMATDYTPNYNLDLYASTDKPNLRDQYNAAMGKIDTQMKANADGITNANANVGTLQTQMQQVQGDVTALESTVETHGTQIAGVQKTANDALSLAQTNESDVTSLTSRVTTVEGTADKNKTDVASLDTRMGAAEGDISNLQTGKAPTNHASTANTYGQGSSTNFGHLKVVDSGTAAASTGTAASPKMVNDAVNIAPTVLNTESVSFTNMTETLSVSVILNAKANLICVSLGEIIVHTSDAIDEVKELNYKLPAQYRPTRKLRAALSVSAAAITVGMNATLGTDGTIEITFGAKEAITSGYTVGGNAMFIYGLS
jgi:hypothetical protein|uniref:Tail needle protein n=1 Tax=Podoviridae sp. ct9H612 TaxID=2825226 RepID=A0A8S5VIK4_9CAUD|nr:MAG TPA: Tail needle protein [Podoviridae sp. ct9H612]